MLQFTYDLVLDIDIVSSQWGSG